VNSEFLLNSTPVQLLTIWQFNLYDWVFTCTCVFVHVKLMLYVVWNNQVINIIVLHYHYVQMTVKNAAVQDIFQRWLNTIAPVVTVAVTPDMWHCCLYCAPAAFLWQCHFNPCMYNSNNDDDDDDDDRRRRRTTTTRSDHFSFSFYF